MRPLCADWTSVCERAAKDTISSSKGSGVADSVSAQPGLASATAARLGSLYPYRIEQ